MVKVKELELSELSGAFDNLIHLCLGPVNLSDFSVDLWTVFLPVCMHVLRVKLLSFDGFSISLVECIWEILISQRH